MKTTAALFLGALGIVLLAALLSEVRRIGRRVIPELEGAAESARRCHYALRNLRYDVKRKGGRGASEPEDDA